MRDLGRAAPASRCARRRRDSCNRRRAAIARSRRPSRSAAAPSSAPTGVEELAAATAAPTLSSVSPRAAAASGSTATRTANFWLPKISTCETPAICEICSANTCCRVIVDLGQRQRVGDQRDEQDRAVGRVDLLEARRRRQRLRQLAQGGGDVRLHVERGAVDVAVEIELHRRSASCRARTTRSSC